MQQPLLTVRFQVYPRASNEVYMCGIGGSKYLDNAKLKKVTPEEITAFIRVQQPLLTVSSKR